MQQRDDRESKRLQKAYSLIEKAEALVDQLESGKSSHRKALLLEVLAISNRLETVIHTLEQGAKR